MNRFRKVFSAAFAGILLGSCTGCSAADPQTHTISLVVINTGDAERPVRVDLSRFGDAVAPGTPVRVIRTSGNMESGEHWASHPDLAADEGGFSAVLAPWSVTTYLISERDV